MARQGRIFGDSFYKYGCTELYSHARELSDIDQQIMH